MNRRQFLGAAASAAVAGLAGCAAGGASCDRLAANANGPVKVATVSMEAAFVQLSDGLMSDGSVSDSQLRQVETELRPCQPVQRTKVGHHEDYGPYEGYVIRDDVSLEAFKNAMEDAGVSLKEEWWAFQPPSSWSDTVGVLEQRLQAIEGYSSEDSLPADLSFTVAGGDELGERVGVVAQGTPTETEITDAFAAVSQSGGFAFVPVGEDIGSESVEYVLPEQTGQYVAGADVVDISNGYELRVDLTDDFRQFVEQQPDTVEAVSLRLPGGTAIPVVEVEDGVPEDPVAVAREQYATDAFAAATAVEYPLLNPLFVDTPANECNVDE